MLALFFFVFFHCTLCVHLQTISRYWNDYYYLPMSGGFHCGFQADESLLPELEADVREECEKLGAIESVKVKSCTTDQITSHLLAILLLRLFGRWFIMVFKTISLIIHLILKLDQLIPSLC